jgi:oxygen-independent coproporphyrinogen-3 oxidase
MQVPHNLYIHVPFCVEKCNYCAFYSFGCADPDWENYADGIVSEINSWGARLGKIDVPTIFFGGGTPSLMPVTILERIIGAITKNFHIMADCEITLESNPGTLPHDKLRDFTAIGMNRLSVGVQSLYDAELKFMGRIHNATDALHLINNATKLGLRVSGDFIYGLPWHSVDDVGNLCRQINDIGVNHCSMYELTIEPGTPFAAANLPMPSNDQMADMYNAITESLNLPRYEVSNYASPGNECRHNQNVWDGEPYIGIGRAAAGRPLIDGVWYEQMGANAIFRPMDNKMRAIEKIITGARQTRGIRMTPDVLGQVDMDYVNSHPDLFQIENGRLRVHQNAILLLDDLLLNLVI